MNTIKILIALSLLSLWRTTLSAPSEMLMIPAGTYLIGNSNGRYDEKPQLKVQLNAFMIDRYEVSNAKFKHFIEKTAYKPQGPWKRGFPIGGEKLPVRFITWYDAKNYANWVKKRLPTEAEWEAAATPISKTSFTNQPFIIGPTHIDTKIDVNQWGLYHIAGNVREWVADWYDKYQYQALANKKTIENPQGPADGTPPAAHFLENNLSAGNERSTRKIVRGASWIAVHANNSRRWAHNPNHWYNDIGFRCVSSII